MIESDWPESDLMFRTAFGEPVYPDTPSQLLPKLIEEYNKQELTPAVAATFAGAVEAAMHGDSGAVKFHHPLDT